MCKLAVNSRCIYSWSLLMYINSECDSLLTMYIHMPVDYESMYMWLVYLPQIYILVVNPRARYTSYSRRYTWYSRCSTHDVYTSWVDCEYIPRVLTTSIYIVGTMNIWRVDDILHESSICIYIVSWLSHSLLIYIKSWLRVYTSWVDC